MLEIKGKKNTIATGVHAEKLQNFKFILTDNVCIVLGSSAK
jgi:hypothetical protein